MKGAPHISREWHVRGLQARRAVEDFKLERKQWEGYKEQAAERLEEERRAASKKQRELLLRAEQERGSGRERGEGSRNREGRWGEGEGGL